MVALFRQNNSLDFLTLVRQEFGVYVNGLSMSAQEKNNLMQDLEAAINTACGA